MRIRLFAASGILMQAACGGPSRDPATDTAYSTGEVESTLRATAREYTEPELLGLIGTGATSTITSAQLGERKATDPEVKEFARTLVSDHRTLAAAFDSVATALKISTSMPGNDEDVLEDHLEAMDALTKRSSGPGFDEAFVTHQLSMQTKILDEVRDALGRDQRPEIRELLTHTRVTLEPQVQRARAIAARYRVTPEH